MTAILTPGSEREPDAGRAAGEPSPSVEKGFREGTHRTRSPEATLAAYLPRMLDFGITRLADVTRLDVIGLPVFMAVRPNSRSLSVAQGKGVDRASAMASALMESIESWHAERIELPLRYDSYAGLRRSAPVIDVERLPRQRHAPRADSAPTLWVEGEDLIGGERTWVPFAAVMTNFVDPGAAGQGFVPTSNGLASGNHPLEATVHAVCELIERDADSWWRATGGITVKRRQVDLATIAQPRIVRLLEQIRAAGLEAAAWETTTDVGVPSFCCYIFEPPGVARWTLRGIFGGHGCHLSAEVALLRALTEAVQSRLTTISGSRDDMFDYGANSNPDDLALVLRETTEEPATRPFPPVDLSTSSFDGDLALLVERLRAVGVERVVAVDLAKPEVGIPVVKVVATDLEPGTHQRLPPGARLRRLLAEGLE